MNVGVSKEQSQALGKAFKYNHHDIKEICLINNNIVDQQFADLLEELMQNEKVFDDLQRITYGGNNELGMKTMQMLDKLINEKHPSFPLTHLTLVECKNHLSTVQPLLLSLETRQSHLQTLVIPQ